MIKTFEEACAFVREHKVCTIFGSKKSPYPSLWDNVDLSEEKPSGGGWSEKVVAVWRWKNEIQISLNIVRSNDPNSEKDQWLTFRDVHLDIVEMHS